MFSRLTIFCIASPRTAPSPKFRTSFACRSMATIKIYGAKTTRSDILEMAAKEIDVPYEFVALDWAGGEHKKDAYLKVNPFGQVPTFTDGDLVLTESGAALCYMAEKYGKGELAADTVEKRAVLGRWVAFANSTLCADLSGKNKRALDVLEKMFEKQAYICGDAFTLADCAMYAYLSWLTYFTRDGMNLSAAWKLSSWPNLAAYYARLKSRPSALMVPLEWVEDVNSYLL